MNNDIYDVSKYTDEQLYNILDINNPSDRELEAKIIHMINKYSIMQNESGYKLAIFFQNIYSHFFDIESETDIIEGFDNNPLQIGKDYIDQSGNAQKNIKNAINTNNDYNTTNATIQDIQSTTSFDYVKDKFGLNPLLKQTIKRIVCIDSKYRDNKNISLSTDFTFNLSEPLRDVVSLKLESIQIPITWYTISNNFGSNFFYLKGNIDGINNGYHDYKIEIPPGNYSTTTTDSNTNITTVLNNSIKDLSNTYPDVNFGNTSIEYNNGNSKITINIDIQKIYNESYFYLQFPYWTPSVNTNLTENELIIYRQQSIASYMGFNNSIYDFCSITSNIGKLNTSYYLQNRNISQYKLDSTNNYFDIIRYIGEEYTPSTTIYDNYRIKLNLPIDISYSINTLYNEVNNVISNSIFLDKSISKLEQFDIVDLNNNNYGKSYFKLTIRLNRYKIKEIPSINTAVIFPNSANNIWNLCFKFDNNINDLSVIYSETPLSPSNYFIDSSVNIIFKCEHLSNYNVPENDFILNIDNGNYLLNDFIKITNDVLYNNIYTQNSSIQKNNDSKIDLIIDLKKKFTINDFDISFVYPNSVLNIIGIESIDNNSTQTSFFINNIARGYSVDSSYILSYKQVVDINYSEYNHVYLSSNYLQQNGEYRFTNYNSLINEIIFSISSTIYNDQYIFSEMTLVANANDIFQEGGRIDVSLKLNIVFYLDENYYNIYFNDNYNNNWKKIGLESFYNLSDFSNNNLNYIQIIGKNVISSNTLSLNDTINILPFYDPSGGSYSLLNSKSLFINTNTTYSIYSLINYINNYFNSNNLFYGSKISIVQIGLNEFIKLNMNINLIYTSKDYKIVFYDPYSFIKCFKGTNRQNSTWDSTLGWMLGFRDYTEYELIQTNQNTDGITNYYLDSVQGIYTYSDVINNDNIVNTLINITGDTSCTLNLYNYFYIILDDYIQNHINDGIISINKNDTNIPLQNYSHESIEICDPVNNTPIISTITNGLTNKQLYSLNQSLISKRNKIKNYSNISYIKDIFAMIPLKIGGIPNGSYYIETGGNLQNQERIYFGPVNIQRMSVKLVTDRGDTIDLNKIDWSFSFICEQLYRT